ncbi:olfactomedin-4-like protein [Lates japonicus]|uniref:Olfactomedin-4-like protein n=1 Tax=Lates japonicus TaxID=270547 RepID=A0AAD3N742_LATJO|nr:olfactomedin-4-like protein [Lates japonicus]
MMLYVIIPLCALLTFTQQVTSGGSCVCDLTNSEQPFPHDKLSTVEDNASKCNSEITRQKEDISVLEKRMMENFGRVYSSLQVIEE